nr:hypothetical protein [Candidatus Njordarchaeota archaeon]
MAKQAKEQGEDKKRTGKMDRPVQLLCVAIIGYDTSNNKAFLKSVHPDFELSEQTVSGIYSLSSFSGNEPGYISLEVDEGTVMSYYTGSLEPLRCTPHCLVLFLDKLDNPEPYKRLLTRMGSVVFPLLCDRDFKEFSRKLYETALLSGELKSKIVDFCADVE